MLFTVAYLAQVQLRFPQKTLEEIDNWEAQGRFKNRSDAIKSIINYYQEREKTCDFLTYSSNEAKKQNNTQNLLSL